MNRSATASLHSATPKKNVHRILLLAGVKFSLKKERTFFFGIPSYRSCPLIGSFDYKSPLRILAKKRIPKLGYPTGTRSRKNFLSENFSRPRLTRCGSAKKNNFTSQLQSVFLVPSSTQNKIATVRAKWLFYFGYPTGTRTPIKGFKGLCPTIRRSGNTYIIIT